MQITTVSKNAKQSKLHSLICDFEFAFSCSKPSNPDDVGGGARAARGTRNVVCQLLPALAGSESSHLTAEPCGRIVCFSSPSSFSNLYI